MTMLESLRAPAREADRKEGAPRVGREQGPGPSAGGGGGALQPRELRQALHETQNRQQTIKKLEFERDHNLDLVESLQGITYVTASPQDRHRIYKALRLRVEVNEEGQVRLSGIFDPDVHLHFVMRDPPIDPSKPLPKIPEGTRIEVVTKTSARPCTS
jgi:hypothetical protein